MLQTVQAGAGVRHMLCVVQVGAGLACNALLAIVHC